jgi:hypothetical protein
VKRGGEHRRLPLGGKDGAGAAEDVGFFRVGDRQQE